MLAAARGRGTHSSHSALARYCTSHHSLHHHHHHLALLGGSFSSSTSANVSRIRTREQLQQPLRCLSGGNMSPAAGLGYTLRVEGRLAEAKARALGPKDVVALFGAFEPYNIVIHPPGAVGGGAKYQAKKGSSLPPPPPVLATFQVPSLKYAQEIAQSFQQDETWGERITVHQEKETFPVFISGLPEGVKGEELKEQIESAAACDPKQLKASGEPEPNGEFDPEVKAKSESLLARTAIDVYDSYAVFKCPDKFTSLGLLQGSFQLTPAGEGGNGLESKQQAASEEGEITAPAGEVLSPISAVGGEQQGGEGEEDDENDPSAVLSYAAWKTYPVRVNGLPADATVEEVMATFRKYMPYDVELLPVESGTRGAYLRFARRVQGTECVAEMKDVTVRGDKTLEVRRAWEKAFPILIEGGEEGRKTTVEELRQLVTTLRMNKDLHVLDAELVEGGAAAIVRFGSQPAAEEGMKLLSAGVGGRGKRVSLAWRDFRVDLNNLPLEVTEEELREMVHLTTPSKVRVSAPIGGKRRSGSVSFTTRPEAELAFSQLSGTGLPDLKLRKAWAVYRLRVKGLPLDTTEEDVREILKGGYEPFQVDFPRSRKGNLKGEAVLRFAAYDQVVAAIGRLYGRDSPLDEAEHQARWTTAGEGISFDDPYGSLAEEVERMSTAEEGKEGMKKGGKEASNAQQELDAMVEKALEGEEGMEELVHRTAPFLKEGDDMSRHGEEGGTERGSGLGLSPEDEKEEEEEEEEDEDEGRDKESVNPFGIYPEGKWVKMLVDTDTTQKIIKGGHILSYRALVVVGNLNGCGGYGVGKAPSMEEAQIRAYRAAKKNLIHVDLYRNRCVTTALYGKHNNCRIYIQAGHPGRPHKEGRMINDILRVLGVECGEARSVGRRNPYSVVRAIFHAISKHEGVEELSRKRGRRLISVSKARYLGL